MRNELYKYNKDSLSYEKVSFKSVYGLPIVLFIVVNMFVGSRVYEPTVIEQVTEVERQIIIDIENEFSYKQLVAAIGNKNFRYPEIVLAQATLESGNFTSDIFKENNNLFGMKLPRLRATEATGENRGHATFETWDDSVDDYALYYADQGLRRLNENKYYEYLKQHYAEDPNYVTKVKRLATKFKAERVFWDWADKGHPYYDRR